MKKMTVPVLALLMLLSACSMRSLPEGERLDSYPSASGEYIVNVYRCSGGATVDFSIRGELVIKETGAKKNIYWNYHEDDATVEWNDNETVTINGHTLNIHKDVYDFRMAP